MVGVAAGLERIVQAAHTLRSLDVDGVLRLDLQRLVARDETEEFDVFVQVFQLEFGGLVGGQVVH